MPSQLKRPLHRAKMNCEQSHHSRADEKRLLVGYE